MATYMVVGYKIVGFLAILHHLSGDEIQGRRLVCIMIGTGRKIWR